MGVENVHVCTKPLLENWKKKCIHLTGNDLGSDLVIGKFWEELLSFMARNCCPTHPYRDEGSSDNSELTPSSQSNHV